MSAPIALSSKRPALGVMCFPSPSVNAWLASLIAVLCLSACGPSNNGPQASASAPGAGSSASGGASAAGGPPPPEVGVITVQPATVGLVTELPGRTEASRVAQVRARAAGILERRRFREGSDVKAGEVLFDIDSAPYRAALASAQATLARAEATSRRPQAQAQRYKPLVEANAVSQQEYVSAVAAQKQAEADVAAGRAAVQTAQITLGYATVTAPISGRIGRALVTEGALVGQGETTPLAVVQQIDPMYVNVTQPVADVLRLRAAIATGRLKSSSSTESADVRIVLDDGSVYPQVGRLLFSDLSVDQGSGQITLRATVPNRDGVLLPGMYVRARLEQAAASNAFLLPQQAVQRTGQGDSVRVVDAQGKLSVRPVKLGAAKNGQWVVLQGLQAGEQVMVDGFQKLQGRVTQVRPVAWSALPAASAMAPAAQASLPLGANAQSQGGNPIASAPSVGTAASRP